MKYILKDSDQYLWNFADEICEKVEEWKSDNPRTVSTHSCYLSRIDLEDIEGETEIEIKVWRSNCGERELKVTVYTDVKDYKTNKMMNELQKVTPLDETCSEENDCRCYFCVLSLMKRLTKEE